VKVKGYKEEYKEINGITQYFLHYPIEKNEVAVFLHGGPGQSEVLFSHCLRPYWDFCSIVYYDQRGVGRTQQVSYSKPEDITIESLIADLKQTIQYIKEKYRTERIVLIGHSWGTILGTMYIQKYPEDVMCYIGYGQVIDSLRGEKIAYDKVKEAIENRGKKRDIVKLNALGNYPDCVVTDKSVELILKLRFLQSKYGYTSSYRKAFMTAIKSPLFSLKDISSLSVSKIFELNVNLLDVLLNFNIWDTAEYQVPVFYVLGRNDWQTPSVLAAEYFNKIIAPKKGCLWIENAGHLTDVDNPPQFCKAIKSILVQL